jgi:hypothetical protein
MNEELHTLQYRGTVGDSVRTRGRMSMALKPTGPNTLITQLRSANVMLSIESLRVDGEGSRIMKALADEGMTFTMGLDQGRVEGVANGKAFKYEFGAGAPAPVMGAEPLADVAWGFGFADRAHMLGSLGEYSLVGEEDANGEALNWMLTAPARLPGHPVAAGAQWTSSWTGGRKSKKTGGSFFYTQSGTLREVSGAGARRAHVAFESTAEMVIPEGANTQREESRLSATGETVLDLETGQVVSTRSTGRIVSDFKAISLKLEFILEGTWDQV